MSKVASTTRPLPRRVQGGWCRCLSTCALPCSADTTVDAQLSSPASPAPSMHPFAFAPAGSWVVVAWHHLLTRNRSCELLSTRVKPPMWFTMDTVFLLPVDLTAKARCFDNVRVQRSVLLERRACVRPHMRRFTASNRQGWRKESVYVPYCHVRTVASARDLRLLGRARLCRH